MATYRRIHQAEKLQKAFRHYGLGLNRPLKLPVKVYSDCEITPSSSSAPALTGGCHGWHEAGSYPVIDDDDDALWNCGNLAAGAQAWAAALAREISNGLWAPASPPSGFSATVSGRPQAGQVHSAGWDMVLGPLMR